MDVQALEQSNVLSITVNQAHRYFKIAVAPIIQKLDHARFPLYRECKDTWYRAENVEVGQREFIVQNADGYLARLMESLGERPVCLI